MVDYLKNWMGFAKKEGENDIPEIHLQKKEQKFYFDKKLNRYVFEGENPDEGPKKVLPPPKFVKGNTDNTKKKKPLRGPGRYASAFGADSIYTPEIPIAPITDDNEKDKIDLENKFIEESKQETKEENQDNVNNIEEKNIDKNDIIEKNPIKEEKEQKEEKDEKKENMEKEEKD